MIANNYKAMERLRDLKDSPLTAEILLELQTALTEGTLDDPAAAGRFRRSPEDDNIVVEDFDGTILHHPPPGSELPARIGQLLAFANDDSSERFIHPVVKAILLHFWIGYDHPFVDGNGRTARAVFYWYMLRKGYWLFEYVSISRIVLKAMGDYKRAYLFSEAGECDATYFLMFNLRAIDIAMDDVHRYIERKKKEIQDSASALRAIPEINFRQRELLLDALKKPGRSYSIYEHKNTHQVSYQTARTDLQDLQAKGFLSAIRDGKTFRYEATDKLNSVILEKHRR
ncbi:MAG: Fic family protein [Elusimicrobiota bacterium]|nr:MAG: Fic family protein [Elusimicrobiota bacterium]